MSAQLDLLTPTMAHAAKSPARGMVDVWPHDAVIAPNNFIYKSLSNWAVNVAVGCSHACRFCYVPSTATNKQAPRLAPFGVTDPDEQWGDYLLIRTWNEAKFRASLKAANETPISDLKADGNRAVMYCSTTDPYQVVRHPDAFRGKQLSDSLRQLVRRSLEMILHESTLNVRILTRSPLARVDFDLFKQFGPRLLFGMSLPTLRNDLAKIYEPKAPAPSQRLATLQAAKDAGLHVYVAIAPTYPESDEADLAATLEAVGKLDPVTIFHEPINIRAENVTRIEEHAAKLGVSLQTDVFATQEAWQQYAWNSLMTVERLAKAQGLKSKLHLWPDKSLMPRFPVQMGDAELAVQRREWLQRYWKKLVLGQSSAKKRRAETLERPGSRKRKVQPAVSPNEMPTLTPTIKPAKSIEVKVGRTKIPIYQLKTRAGFQFRYYVGGVPKRVTRTTLADIREEAERIAFGLENGRVQAGDLSAADVQGYYHAMAELEKVGPDAPPLHLALAEYAAAKSLLPDGMSLAEAVRQFLQLRPLAGPAKPVSAVFEELLVSLADSRASVRHVRNLRTDLGKWMATLPPGMTIDRVTAEDLRGYLRTMQVGPRRRDNIRDTLVTFFRFARANRYLPEGRQTEPELIKRINHVHEIKFLSPEQLATFLGHVDPYWLPWMVLGAFAGLRTSEITGLVEDPAHERLRWSDLRWDSGTIIVPKTVAAKIKRPRRVPMRANLQAWLLPWRNATGYIYPKVRQLGYETDRLKRATGLAWVTNGLRHSYATYRMAEIGNASQVAEEMGTSPGRIKANYDAVPADILPGVYFGIAPSATATPKIVGMDGFPA